MSQTPRTPTPRPSAPAAGYFQSAGPDCTDITVYQQGGAAVVREERTLDLKSGGNTVLLDGMPTQFEPNSLSVLGYEGAVELSLGPISYRAANLDKMRILAGAIGQPVTVERLGTDGRARPISGTLKAILGNEAAVERTDNKRLFFAAISLVELDNGIPKGLSATPSLVLAPKAKTEGSYKLKLLYEAGGFGWSARHSAFYDETAGKLTCFETAVAITNQSGANVRDAQLRLLAGANYTRRRSRGGLESAPKGGGRILAQGASPMMSASFDAAESVQETVGDAKMYSLSDSITIADGEQQQVTLARASDVPVQREYFLDGGWYQQSAEDEAPKQSVMVRLRMINDAAHNLGQALPAGEVLIFQMDASGAPQKIGSGNLAHLAEGEKFKLEFGPSSDVKATRRMVGYKDFDEELPVGTEVPEGPHPLPSAEAQGDGALVAARPTVARPRAAAPAVANGDEQKKPRRFRDEERELVLRNYKSEPVEVIVTEQLPAQFEWLQKPDQHEFVQDAPGAQTVKVTVGGKGTTVVRYSIRHQIA